MNQRGKVVLPVPGGPCKSAPGYWIMRLEQSQKFAMHPRPSPRILITDCEGQQNQKTAGSLPAKLANCSEFRGPPQKMSVSLTVNLVNIVLENVIRVRNELTYIANTPLVTDSDDRSINEAYEVFGSEEVTLAGCIG